VNIDNRIRTAIGATAATVREVPPLTLPADPVPARPGRLPVRRPRRGWSGWLIPVAAAVAVIAVAATLVAVRTVSGPAPHGVGQPGPATSGVAANPNQVPAYYALVTKPTAATPADLTIAETATGKTLFTIKPPQNTSFGSVTAAADDRTFVVAVAPLPSDLSLPMAVVGWDLLRVNPGATGYTLRRLSIPATPRKTLLGGFALSPDGTELALLFDSDTVGAMTIVAGTATLRVYSVASGQALHTWQSVSKQSLTGLGANSGASGTVTWLANGHGLAFVWDAAENTGQNLLKVTPEVWRLELAKPPGTGLLAGSTPVVMNPTGVFAGGVWVNGICSRLYATADGNGAVCGTESMLAVPNGTTDCQATMPPLAFRAYSGDGSYRVLYTVPSAKAPKGKCVDGKASVLWASPSGSTLVGVVSTALVSGSLDLGPFTNVVGVLAHGRWTPLPIHVQLGQVAALAF
jgi:hypothetical protein